MKCRRCVLAAIIGAKSLNEFARGVFEKIYQVLKLSKHLAFVSEEVDPGFPRIIIDKSHKVSGSSQRTCAEWAADV